MLFGQELLSIMIYEIKLALPTFIGGTLCPQQIHPNRAAAQQQIGKNCQKGVDNGQFVL